MTCTGAGTYSWAQYGATMGYALTGLDGLTTVRGCVRDAAHNVGSLTPGTITLDTLPPIAPAVVIDSGAQYVNATQVATRGGNIASVSGTATGAFEWAIGETASPSAFNSYAGLNPQNFTFGGTGLRTLYGIFRDDVGNATLPVSTTITFDVTPPSGSFTLEGTLADGLPSPTYTSTTSVTLLISQTGASGYLAGNETLVTCPAAGYTTLSGQSVSYSLTGTATPRQVKLCLIDAAGNVSGPVTQSINLLPAAPTGCAATLTGTKVDGSAAPAGKTGVRNIIAGISGCSAPLPTDVFLTTSPVTCSATASYAWVQYGASLPFALTGADGLTTVRGCVPDAAHNVGSLSAGTITLQTQPPAAPRLVIDSGAPYVNQAQVIARGGNIASVAGTATGAFDWALSETPSFSIYSSYISNNPRNFPFGGTGLRTLYGVFRDDVGTARRWSRPPSPSTPRRPTSPRRCFASSPPTGRSYTNSLAVTLTLLQPPSDPERMAVNYASGATCAYSDFSTVNSQPFAPTSTFLLPPGEVTRVICVELLDAAGNPSTILSDSVTVDTIPPSAPVITTPSGYVTASQVNPFPVTTSAAVSDLHFKEFQKVGGDLFDLDPRFQQPGHDLVLVQPHHRPVGRARRAQPAAASGRRRRGQRERGRLGHHHQGREGAGGRADGPALGDEQRLFWNAFWQPSPSLDVAGYNVYYGAASKAYSGENAAQGPSPVRVGLTNRLTLSGLTNGSPTYVIVHPVDLAGNETPANWTDVEIELQPNRVSPDLIAVVPTAHTAITRLARSESTLYALGYSGTCPGVNGILQAMDLSTLTSAVQSGTIGTPPAPALGTAITLYDNLDCLDVDSVDLQVDGNYLYVTSGQYVRIYRLVNPLNPTLVTTLAPGFVVRGVAVRGDIVFVNGVAGQVEAIDMSKLFDNNAGTWPSLGGDMIGKATNGTISGSGLLGIAWSRDRVMRFMSGSSTYNVTNAIDGNPLTIWDNTTLMINGVARNTPNVRVNPVTSGNYLYSAGYNQFLVMPLNNVWSGLQALNDQSPVLALTNNGSQFEIQGAQVFLTDEGLTGNKGIKALDLATVTAPVQMGSFEPPSLSDYMNGAIAYGNYLLSGQGGSVLVWEVATPRSIHLTAQTALGGASHALSGAFLVSMGTVIDLQGGPGLPSLGTVSPGCTWGSTLVDENEIFAAGSSLKVLSLEKATDCDSATAFDATSLYSVPMTLGTRAKSVAAYGNYLVASEQRAGGTYLEVFDLRKLRNRRAAPALSAADTVGSYFVTASVGRSKVTMYQGRAFMTLEGQGVYIVDLRPLFDDNAATGLTADSLQGFFADAAGTPMAPAVQGRYMYVIDYQGLKVVDVFNALDEDPLTKLPGSPTKTSLALFSAQAIAVSGSYAVVVGWTTIGVSVVDISTPLSPKVLSATPFSGATGPCTSPDGENVVGQYSVSIHGSRAYVTLAAGLTYVYELE